MGLGTCPYRHICMRILNGRDRGSDSMVNTLFAEQYSTNELRVMVGMGIAGTLRGIILSNKQLSTS